jgi:Bifunctional DNA primase/polymerase, N-terminal
MSSSKAEAAVKVGSAIQFAEIGCRILPADGKNPGGFLGKGWQDQATRDPAVIEQWWNQWPNANIAALSDNAFLPIDVDDPGSWDAFCAAHTPSPPTPHYLTGGKPGRARWLFQLPARLPQRRMIAPGVELRHSTTSNLVVIVPPGINPDSGERYEWLAALDEVPIAPIPTDWLQATSIPRPAERPAGEWVERFCRDYTTGCGETHPSTMALAAYLVRKLGSGEVALELLLAWNQRRCKPPKPEEEIVRQVRWAVCKEAGR